MGRNIGEAVRGRLARFRLLATVTLVLSLAAPRLGAASAGPALRTADVLALAKRLARFSDSLPDTPQLGVAEIVAFEEHKWFACLLGRTPGGSGAGGETPTLVRRVIFLKPSTFVVDDQVAAAVPVRWLLRSRGKPEIDGRRVRVEQDDARLTCETLLPQGAAPNLAPDNAGGHIVQVMPPAGRGTSRFLHVLHTGGDAAAAPRAKVLHQDGLVRVTVSVDDRTCELALPAAGAAPGTIAVATADGQTLLPRRLLPSGILPHGPKGVAMLERWDRPYHGNRRPGWDTGRPSTELKKVVEDGTVRPGRAVVLGCGTGTNAVYLARKGFDITAIDIAPAALARGEAKARQAGVRVRFLLADVLAPPPLGAFDFIFDRGCYHHVRRLDAAGFVKAVCGLARGGTQVLILAGNANEPRRGGPPRVKEDEIRRDFSAPFDVQWLREIRFDTPNPERQGALAWSVLLRRKAAGEKVPAKTK